MIDGLLIPLYWTIKVLVEEFCYTIRRGRIAQLTIDRRNYKLLEYKIILDLSTHLSFPFIQRKGGTIYISPENSESGSWNMYEYDPHAENLNRIRTIVEKPLTDAIMTDLFGEELIFATELPDQNGSALNVYSSKGKLLKTISFPSCIARNAGDWFKINNRIYRPAQDCNGAYGRAVILQEIIHNDKGSFKDVGRIESTNPSYSTGCHTFNYYKGLTVVDLHGYRRPLLAKTAESIRLAIKG